MLAVLSGSRLQCLCSRFADGSGCTLELWLLARAFAPRATLWRCCRCHWRPICVAPVAAAGAEVEVAAAIGAAGAVAGAVAGMGLRPGGVHQHPAP